MRLSKLCLIVCFAFTMPAFASDVLNAREAEFKAEIKAEQDAFMADMTKQYEEFEASNKAAYDELNAHIAKLQEDFKIKKAADKVKFDENMAASQKEFDDFIVKKRELHQQNMKALAEAGGVTVSFD